MIRVCIVEDERPARDLIKGLLATDGEIELVGEYGSVAQAVGGIGDLKPDLLFLDIQLADATGFDVLRALKPEQMPLVVFVTAYDQHAIRAFSVHALDYLLKPFSKKRFYQSLARAKAHIRKDKVNEMARSIARMLSSESLDDHVSGSSRENGSFLRRIQVSSAGKLVYLDVGDIEYLESADHYIEVHTGGRSYLIHDTMANLEEQLDPERFVRIHRTTIVNRDKISEVRKGQMGRYQIHLQDGSIHSLSRSRRDKLGNLIPREKNS
jgi:two-component system LytT family response regulator